MKIQDSTGTSSAGNSLQSVSKQNQDSQLKNIQNQLNSVQKGVAKPCQRRQNDCRRKNK